MARFAQPNSNNFHLTILCSAVIWPTQATLSPRIPSMTQQSRAGQTYSCATAVLGQQKHPEPQSNEDAVVYKVHQHVLQGKA